MLAWLLKAKSWVTDQTRIWMGGKEEGASIVEYALVLTLICVVTLAVVVTLGNQISAAFQSAATSI